MGPFPFQALVDEHFQQRLVTNSLPLRDLAGPLEIRIRKTKGDLRAWFV
jgi:hypothetical protein